MPSIPSEYTTEQVLHELVGLLGTHSSPEAFLWLEQQLGALMQDPSTQRFLLSYTLIGRHFNQKETPWGNGTEVQRFLSVRNVSLAELARTVYLSVLLKGNDKTFSSSVKTLNEIADSGELAGFLRCLILLPDAERFLDTAVQAVRTNIREVFDAIALDNPYPAAYFNEAQWNQMYLKAAFMQRPLDRIVAVDQRANLRLSRIISDYAHERWAAGRNVDPYFWRPVAEFITESELEGDMQRLLQSANRAEQLAAVLCLTANGNRSLQYLLKGYEAEVNAVHEGELNWNLLTQNTLL